jgi:branched-chain amino acid aminotransferase
MIRLLPEMGFEVEETPFSPFELQKADEVWLTNAVRGLQWVGNFRKKIFTRTAAEKVVEFFNHKLELNGN